MAQPPKLTDEQRACLEGQGVEKPAKGERPTDEQRAAFEAEATVPAGASYNGAFIAWLQNRLSSSKTSINGLLAEWAAAESVDRYNSIGEFDPTP